MKLSIIVPVYNREKYLEECIDSILAQTFKDFEAIFINDGSTDNSQEILEKYAAADSRVVVISQENKGQSRRRNYGLSIAKGEYIGFADSDDIVLSNMYEKMITAMEENSVDYVICGLERFFDKSDFVVKSNNKDFICSNEQELINKIILPMLYPMNNESSISCSHRICLYKKKIIDDFSITFKELSVVLSEDLCFNLEYLSHCSSVASISDNLYRYRQNLESYSRKSMNFYERKNVFINQYNLINSLFRDIETVPIRNAVRILEGLSVVLRLGTKYENLISSFKICQYVCGDQDIQRILSFDCSGFSMRNRIMQFLITGRHALMLLILLKVYNVVYNEQK